MNRIASIFFLTGCILFSAENSFAADNPGTQHHFFMTRASLAPVISFFNPNADYSGGEHSKAGFSLGIKVEPMFKGKLHLLAGLEYVNQGLSFDSYYFSPGYSYLYDKKFDYHHSLRFNEFQVPLLIKYSLARENNDMNTFYGVAGWALRYLFKANTVISEVGSGVVLYDGNTDLRVENSASRIGGVLEIGFGRQRNSISDGRALYMELLYKYSISRFEYLGDHSSNDIFIKDSNLSVNIGFRF